ncbi:adenylate/guanylate cyclase domain-containing protein [Falsiruegeria mediterranea]|uniref:Adenylate cyclase 1 n=1 Tax=Falsiruegeria mediterranea M17 TaxID=1200281 RepID=A0A2R8C8F6_9RHOB|nr:adenylate/guanylate cyclase domain-containing protein [Falsiruegeria mediterranea]SPJ28720.1 Adenylate cyclase 1 [Falsiruegeria mediterranea M17]
MQDIQSWLAKLGLEKYGPAFAEAEIQFSDLVDLTEEDLKEVGLPVGPRRRASSAIRAMAENDMPAAIGIANDPTKEPQHQEQLDTSSDAERRHLTVMFVDLVGSTEMATRLDAEDMRTVITGYQNTVAGVVSRYEGFVAKFMGDGVMCYFGWPRAGEDDAERAVRAGLAIIDSVRSTKAPDGTALATRIGVATGVVIVGDLIGSGATQEAAVVGETPNLAARLQGVAGPNQLVLPSETRRLLGSTYKLTSIGTQELKGVGTPVEAFVVEGEAAQESRFAARQSGTLTPIVGRDREIDLMLERWALARSEQGQMVIVSGEAGIGKSRITRAVIDEVAKDDHTRITYQCSPYHADSAFYPVIQQLSFAAGFAPSDGPDVRLDKLEALLGQDPETLKLITPMMGLDGTARYGALNLTPAQQRAHTMKTLAKLLVQQSQDRPVLLVYEDLHWIDPTSLELLDLLLDTIADQKIMILATARPSFEYGFGGHPIVTRFALNRLGKDQIGDIVAKLTGGKALPDEIMAIVAARTDGVPLFVEELTKTILESGSLKEDGDRLILDGPLSTIAIPTTLHDSLMARLDRLQPIKEVAQTAACIGREFSHGLLAQISLLPDAELTAALDGLIAAELIYRRGLPPEATYLFKHALVRDAAYESQLKEKRRAIHARILTELEADTDIAPEVLAVHAEAAGLTERAIDLWEAASKTAIARPAFDEAISHLGRAIELITPQLENSDAPPFERALGLQVPLSMTLLARKGFTADETLDSFEKALVLADKVGETPMRYSILYGLWIGKGARGQHREALRSAEALVEETANAPNTPPMVVANRVAGASHFLMGNFAEAQRYLDVALANYDSIAHAGLANQFGQDIGVTIHIFQAMNSLMLGQTERATTHLNEAESVAKSTDHIQTICYLLNMRFIYGLASGDRPDVERCLNEVSPIAQEHNLALWSAMIPMCIENLAAYNGDKTSMERWQKAGAAIDAIKFKLFIVSFHVDLARSALAMGFHDDAAELAMKAQELIDETGETYTLSDLHRVQAEIAMADDDAETAENYLVTALDVARQQGAKLWELRAAIDLASLLHEQGRIDEAITLLTPIHNSIAEGDCPEDQATVRKLLAELAA